MRYHYTNVFNDATANMSTVRRTATNSQGPNAIIHNVVTMDLEIHF